jgi:hypothetical protein
MAQGDTYKGRLDKAKGFYTKAETEFANARKEIDELSIRQSAEKAWAGVVEATNALFLKKGLKLPKGTRRREEMLFDLQKKDNKIADLHLGERFSYLMHNLHIDCFYEGEVSVKRVQRDIRKVGEYINSIEMIQDGRK